MIESCAVLTGTIVAYDNGTPFMRREDGWYCGDVRQPDLSDDAMRKIPVLRRGWHQDA